MALKYKLKIVLDNRIGTFTGYSAVESSSLEDVTFEQKAFLRSFNKLTSLAIYTEDGGDMCFNEHILKESVIQLKIVSVLCKE